MKLRKRPLLLFALQGALMAPAAELQVSEIHVTEAMKVLSASSTFEGRFFTGYSADVAPQSIALLVVLASDHPVREFKALSNRAGVPALYGLAGLWICDPTRKQFESSRELVLKRDGPKLIRARRYDIVSERSMESYIVGRKRHDAKPPLVVAFGSHISERFKLRSEVPSASIDNGVLPHVLTNPWWEHAYLSEKHRDSSETDQRVFELASVSVKEDLIYNSPASILVMLGLDSKSVLELLKGSS